MREWMVTAPYYGRPELDLQVMLESMSANGWHIFAILQPERCIVAYRDKKGKK